MIEQPKESLLGVLVAALGVPLYAWSRKLSAHA